MISMFEKYLISYHANNTLNNEMWFIIHVMPCNMPYICQTIYHVMLFGGENKINIERPEHSFCSIGHISDGVYKTALLRSIDKYI